MVNTIPMNLDEFVSAEKERIRQRATATIISANVGRWLGGLSSIPREVVEAGRSVLLKAHKAGAIRDFRLYSFGDDLHIQINTLGEGLHNSKVHKLAYDAANAALADAQQRHLYHPIDGQDLFRLSPSERIAAMRLRPVEFPFTERGAEPIIIAKLINGAVGAFNRMLFNLFFHPDKGSHQRLDGARFMAIVENVPDLVAGKRERRLYAFGDRPQEERLFLVYPFLSDELEMDRDQVGDWGELLSMVANPVEWAISAVYAVQGRFVIHGKNWQATRHEPVAVVSVESASPGSIPEDPVAIVRLQSGLPAVGESHFNLGADFHYTVGGPGGGYHVGVMPVTMAQAQAQSREEGTAKIVAYTYQSYDQGRIPPDHDVIDLFAQDSVQTEWLQQEAREFIQLMVQHGAFQPYLTAEEAERRARARADQLKSLFKPIPSGEKGEVDPLVAKANRAAQGLTLSDIKADAGGKVGHTTPVTLFEFAARASLTEAQEQGLIQDFQVFSVGDDLHLLMYHRHGVDSNDIHLLAFRAFWRVVWITELIGYK
ncbi:MAG: fructose 1,6-bisphosphatase, partial [Candidatus Binatia bacterium]